MHNNVQKFANLSHSRFKRNVFLFFDWTWTTFKTTFALPACGVSLVTSRIVGGVKADILEFPWMVMLLYKGTFYCGGSLVSDRYVLTASHCVLNFKPSQITVKIYDPANSRMVSRTVEKLYGNDRFNLDTFNNDIALVRLLQPVNVVDQYVTVCLPTPGKNFAGMDGTVAGWGKLSNGTLSQTLQQVKVPIMTNQQCKKSAYRATRITDNMMCAGYSEGGRDACQVRIIAISAWSYVLTAFIFFRVTVEDHFWLEMPLFGRLSESYRGVRVVPNPTTQECTHEWIDICNGSKHTPKMAASVIHRNSYSQHRLWLDCFFSYLIYW